MWDLNIRALYGGIATEFVGLAYSVSPAVIWRQTKLAGTRLSRLQVVDQNARSNRSMGACLRVRETTVTLIGKRGVRRLEV